MGEAGSGLRIPASALARLFATLQSCFNTPAGSTRVARSAGA